jgi:hypothetical protein
MSYDLTPGIKLSAQDHDFHSRELARLRELAATITTKAVKARILRQLQEHAVLIGLDASD